VKYFLLVALLILTSQVTNAQTTYLEQSRQILEAAKLAAEGKSEDAVDALRAATTNGINPILLEDPSDLSLYPNCLRLVLTFFFQDGRPELASTGANVLISSPLSKDNGHEIMGFYFLSKDKKVANQLKRVLISLDESYPILWQMRTALEANTKLRTQYIYKTKKPIKAMQEQSILTLKIDENEKKLRMGKAEILQQEMKLQQSEAKIKELETLLEEQMKSAPISDRIIYFCDHLLRRLKLK
jgi:hypothetical protein